jgi:hypothetical protein
VADGIAADPIAATISNAGSVVVEGYRVYQPTDGTIDSVEGQVASDVANFSTSTIASQLGVSGNALFQVQPGAEIINPNGNPDAGEQLGPVEPSDSSGPAGQSHHPRLG